MSTHRNPPSRTALASLFAIALAPLAACGEGQPVQAPLEVAVILGSGDGLVVSEPAGIACGRADTRALPMAFLPSAPVSS